MCGIAGIFGSNGEPVKYEEVRAMCDMLVHRGPNDEGYYLNANVGLGMRRLSVIDLETGQQPVSNTSGTVQVVLNGEIYNFRELRQQLRALGYLFRTEGDTEVIAHLYDQYGNDFVQHLRGMFAIALWDETRQKLVLVRDRLGVKPLYYGEFEGRLIFASELKALLQIPAVKRDLNWSAVGHLFSFLTTPSDESIIAGVHKLEPGKMLTIEAGKRAVITQYWDVVFAPDHGKSEGEFVEELREKLRESVRIRMISDVPLGAFLSGGIDSSAVVAMMAQQSSAPIKTFSIGFREKAFNEADHAREVSRAFDTDHHELILEPDVLGILDDLVWKLDEPFGDSSAIPTYMVSRMAAEHVTVALSGDGGDEIFAGYDKYLVEQRERRYRHIPAVLRKTLGAVGGRMKEGMKGRNFLRHIALDGGERYLDAGTMFGRESQQSLFRSEVAEQILESDPWQGMSEELDKEMSKSGGHWLSAIQYADIKHYLPSDIMTKVDRMSMAHSLEARSPLLDHKLVEFAATIPAEFKLRDGSTKHILKEAMRGVLPDPIIDRRKQGFAVPLGSWFRGEINQYVRELLLSPTSRGRNIFNADYIEKLLVMHQNGRPLDLALWTLISFELWCRQFLDQPASGQIRECRGDGAAKEESMKGRQHVASGVS